ncbi:MAG: RNA 2',3'-cyclic phosphodiesterase [Synergistaceae bacterium]|nr:RNA 2',3'-cyclic phosphodiesterase [Synergistaceae bacterium]
MHIKNEEYIRTFVCVCPTPESSLEISNFVVSLRRFDGFRWATPEQIHITLRFLGEAEPSLVQKMDTALSGIGGMRSFKIALGETGGFPNISCPKALWLGVSEGGAELAKLAAKVERAARLADFAPERRKFKAHLTIARARRDDAMSDDLARELQRAPSPSWECSSFVLMKSDLTPEGAVYTPLREYPL